jgi:hypothetical protein
MGSFLNLSNHPISTWTDTQRTAALILGFGEPMDLPGGMPTVSPYAESDEVSTLARDIATQAESLGVAGAFVAGEPTLSFALVSELTTRGIRCFAATTSRESVETPADDGSVHRAAVFRFVRWREYSR